MPQGRPGEALASARRPLPPQRPWRQRVTGASGLPVPSAHQVSSTRTGPRDPQSELQGPSTTPQLHRISTQAPPAPSGLQVTQASHPATPTCSIDHRIHHLLGLLPVGMCHTLWGDVLPAWEDSVWSGRLGPPPQRSSRVHLHGLLSPRGPSQGRWSASAASVSARASQQMRASQVLGHPHPKPGSGSSARAPGERPGLGPAAEGGKGATSGPSTGLDRPPAPCPPEGGAGASARPGRPDSSSSSPMSDRACPLDLLRLKLSLGSRGAGGHPGPFPLPGPPRPAVRVPCISLME